MPGLEESSKPSNAQRTVGMSLYLHSQRGAQVLAGLEQFRQADIGVVRPAHDAARLLGRVVDARLLGIHVGAVDDGAARMR